jgi:hypothetical protein
MEEVPGVVDAWETMLESLSEASRTFDTTPRAFLNIRYDPQTALTAAAPNSADKAGGYRGGGRVVEDAQKQSEEG